jgi:ribosomal protein L37E
MVKKFQRRRENFVCERCGMSVVGDGYTDHCPACLWGKHVDIFPGDRLEECHGLLKPIAFVQKKSSGVLEYQCQRCGEAMNNRLGDSDSRETLVTLAKEWSDGFAKKIKIQ